MTPRHWLLIPTLILSTAAAPAPGPVPSQEQAMALLKAGKRQEALQMLNATIAAHPADLAPALYSAAALYLEDGNWQAAKPLAEQLTRLRPSSFDSWQLAIQAEQAAGDTDARDAAINALYAAWHSALDPNIQSRVSFVRDRIFGPKRTLIAGQTLEPGGGRHRSVRVRALRPRGQSSPYHGCRLR